MFFWRHCSALVALCWIKEVVLVGPEDLMPNDRKLRKRLTVSCIS